MTSFCTMLLATSLLIAQGCGRCMTTARCNADIMVQVESLTLQHHVPVEEVESPGATLVGLPPSGYYTINATICITNRLAGSVSIPGVSVHELLYQTVLIDSDRNLYAVLRNNLRESADAPDYYVLRPGERSRTTVRLNASLCLLLSTGHAIPVADGLIDGDLSYYIIDTIYITRIGERSLCSSRFAGSGLLQSIVWERETYTPIRPE